MSFQYRSPMPFWIAHRVNVPLARACLSQALLMPLWRHDASQLHLQAGLDPKENICTPGVI